MEAALKPIVVIKIGGALIQNDLNELWRYLAALRDQYRLVLVHGAGPQTSALVEQLGGEVQQVQGRRVTGDLDLKALLYCGRGELNARLCASATAHGVHAVGLSGADSGFLRVERRQPWKIDGRHVDFGWVGDVKGVDTALLDVLLRQSYLPVIATLGVDHSGQLFNVNGDTCAMEIAAALNAVGLWFMTSAGGVLEEGRIKSEFSLQQCQAGVTDGWINGGMLVKLSCGFEALSRGIRDVRVMSTASEGTRLVPS